MDAESSCKNGDVPIGGLAGGTLFGGTSPSRDELESNDSKALSVVASSPVLITLIERNVSVRNNAKFRNSGASC